MFELQESSKLEMEQTKEKFEIPIVAQVAAGFAISALVLIGISGSIYKLVAPQGWVVQAFFLRGPCIEETSCSASR